MNAVFHFLEVLVICVAALIGLTLVLIVIVAHLPGSPLKDLLAALTKRIGATAAVSLLAIPLEPIPGVDAVYDLAGIIFLAVYWFGFFKSIANAVKSRPSVVVDIDPRPRGSQDLLLAERGRSPDSKADRR